MSTSVRAKTTLELLEKAGNFPELSDIDWLYDLGFAVDILAYMNNLNVKLQGKDQFTYYVFRPVYVCV